MESKCDDLHEEGVERGEAEAFDQDRGELVRQRSVSRDRRFRVTNIETHTLHAAVRDVRRGLDNHQKPDLDVQARFDRLRELPGAVFHASLILHDSLNRLDTILLVDEPSIHWGIREEEEGHDGPRDCESSEYKKDCL